jgi:UDP-N-acetylmuramoyl-tripeptide--D-alanyl-D-alanine ligase
VLARLAAVHRATLGRRTRVVAVVGSFGKTTAARAVATALGLDSRSLHDNYTSFVALALLKIHPGDAHAVIEVGIHEPGQMARYARLLRPKITVVTSVGSEDNRSLGQLEVTRDEKAEMLRALPRAGLAVLNGDDPNVYWMRHETKAKIRTYGFGAANNVRASDIALDWPHGTRFTLHVDGTTRRLRVRLLGRQMLYPILAAVTVALAEGRDLDTVVRSLEALAPTPGRLQPVRLENGAFVVRDDFKGSLETIESALDLLAEIPAERRIVVLGDVQEPPGSQGPIYARLGERLAGIADRVIVLGETRRYAAGARRSGHGPLPIVDARRSVLQAIETVRADLRPGDVILVKGRSTQRLERVALALEGRTVRCGIEACDAMLTRSDRCSMLERGWDGLPAIGHRR